MGFFGRNPDTRIPPEPESPQVLSPSDMGLDTLASVIRILGEFPFDQARMTGAAFSRLAEQWARHITTGTPAPGGSSPASLSSESRRDWTGVRNFVTEYCSESSTHTRSVLGDLRQVIWVFIQNLSHQMRSDEAADGRVNLQLERLEKLAVASEPSALKKEVLSTVIELGRVMEERRVAQKQRVSDLGNQVKVLGQELDVTRRQSEVDVLTQLFNRRAFDEYLERTLELQRVFNQDACLMMVDVDNFKTINDSFGHPVGDDVLRKVADAVTRLFIRKSDFVARFGGDEIAVVLRETTPKEAQTLSSRLLNLLRDIDIERDGIRVKVRGSVGVASSTVGDTCAAWIERADKALYEAKRAGRDRAVVAGD